MATEQLDNLTRQERKGLLSMSTGCAFDFSKASLASFGQTSLSLDALERHGGSEGR